MNPDDELPVGLRISICILFIILAAPVLYIIWSDLEKPSTGSQFIVQDWEHYYDHDWSYRVTPESPPRDLAKRVKALEEWVREQQALDAREEHSSVTQPPMIDIRPAVIPIGSTGTTGEYEGDPRMAWLGWVAVHEKVRSCNNTFRSGERGIPPPNTPLTYLGYQKPFHLARLGGRDYGGGTALPTGAVLRLDNAQAWFCFRVAMTQEAKE